MKRLIISIAMFATTAVVMAQSGTNSPYSQFGFGELTGETTGFNRAMNGVGVAFNDGKEVNYLNPASYSKMDSLTFIFDVGLSLQLTNFKEGGHKQNANNANFDYAVAGFRVARNLGVSFGLVPITQIGYNYATVSTLGPVQSGLEYSKTFQGNGGMRKVYLGAGWEPIRNISIGFNAAYVWGDYTHNLINAYSDNTIKSLTMVHQAEINTYKLDFGAQYTAHFGKKDALTLGVTYGLGHKINADAINSISSVNSQTNQTNATNDTLFNVLQLPHSFGAGLMWRHGNTWRVGVDYTMQRWGSTSFPVVDTNNPTNRFYLDNNYFQNRHRIAIGGEYCRNTLSRNFFQRIRYRAGVGYASPHINIAGNDGPKEISASIGFGIPIINSYNNRSILNISAQWVRQQAQGMLKENTFRICVGLTFNERWFQKWKFE